MTSDLVNQKVVQHNDLITSMSKMNRNALKMFELAVSYIDVENPPENDTVHIPKRTVYQFMNCTERSAKEAEMKKTVMELLEQSSFYIEIQLDNNRVDREGYNPIMSAKWNNYQNHLRIRFNNEIMPYLIHLKREFTQYMILDLVDLNSKYSIIIYKWLSMHYNQYEAYKNTYKRTKAQLKELKNPYIELDELRVMTNTVKGYNRLYDLERYVVHVAEREITEFTHFNVKVVKVKQGRKVVGFRFEVEKKRKFAELPYKENDQAYIDDLKEKENHLDEMYADAMKSPYTTILGDNMVIGLKEFQDTDTMASLTAYVYPKYQILEQRRGLNGVKDHINYVANHKQGYSQKKHNIVKYLLRSIDQYLSTMKLQDLD